jgi:hypothetical protein
LEEKDFGLVDYVLAPFEDVHPGENDRECASDKLYAIASAAAHLAAVFGAFDTGFRDQLEPYKSAAFSTLSEKWPTVITWLRLLLLRFFKTREAPKTIGNCAGFLRSTLLTFKEEGRAEELFSLPCTIDLVYLLVCRTEVYPEEVHAVASVTAILGVFRLCVHTSSRTGFVTAASFSLRLSTVKERTRKTVISTLVRRVEDLSQPDLLKAQLRLKDQRMNIPLCLQALSSCVDNLLQANPSLWKTFADQGLTSTFCGALNKIANAAMSAKIKDQEFWSEMAKAIVEFIPNLLMKHSPNRRYGLATATEAGLITGAMICLLQLDRGGYPGRSFHLKEQVKELVQFHFTSTRIVRAFANAYPQELMDDIRDRRPDLRDLHSRVDTALHRGLAIFEVFGRSEPHLCDNIKVRRTSFEKMNIH